MYFIQVCVAGGGVNAMEKMDRSHLDDSGLYCASWLVMGTREHFQAWCSSGGCMSWSLGQKHPDYQKMFYTPKFDSPELAEKSSLSTHTH